MWKLWLYDVCIFWKVWPTTLVSENFTFGKSNAKNALNGPRQAGPKSQNLITDNFAWMDFAGTTFDYNALLIIIPAVQLQSQKSLSLSDVIIWKQKWNFFFFPSALLWVR